MSTFGSPGTLPTTKPTPPQRGSFPLDHDGECKHVMMSYLNCIKKVKGVNEDECRSLAKSYLSCRMDHNLMAKDDFKNLGFKEKTPPKQDETPSSKEAGVKGELPVHRRVHRRSISSTPKLSDYLKTLPNLCIGNHTRVIYQGFTGRQATADAEASIAWGTKVVGGVTPGRTGTHLCLPVLPTVRSAVRELKPNATAIYVAAHHAAGAIEEAIEAEIPLIVAVAEHIPVHDMLRIHSILGTQSRSRLVGPNSPGITSAVGKCRIGFHPLSCISPGKVGIAAKSGTLSYEAIASTTKAGLGQSLCIGVGGDIVPGTSLEEALSVLARDEDTEAIALIGEIGGEDEMRAAEWIKAYNSQTPSPKPIVGLIAGITKPPARVYYPLPNWPTPEFSGRVMGHAGAFTTYGGQPDAEDKISALKAAGVTMIYHPGQFGDVLKRRLEETAKTGPGASQGGPRSTHRRQFHTSHRPLLSLNSSSTSPVPHQQQIRHLTIPSREAFSYLQREGIPCGPFEGEGLPRFLAVSINRAPCVLVSGGTHAAPLAPYQGGVIKSVPLPFREPPADDEIESKIMPAVFKNLELIASPPPLGYAPPGEWEEAQLLRFFDFQNSLAKLLKLLIGRLFYKHEGIFLGTHMQVYGTRTEAVASLKVTNTNWYFDDAAAFRRRQLFPPPPSTETPAPSPPGLVYIKFPGDQRTIGTLVNGAGLAMNTVDNLRDKAANFLDTGGKATGQTVKEGFEVILKDERVKVIFVNIFGGLTKGDMIAEGVVNAFRELETKVPVVVRIKGTNEEEARRVIEQSGLGGWLVAVDGFEEGVEKVLALS
ncbi:putative succinyl-CoA ligase subunit alpha, mitochondrial [Cladorrhinum sp. PSN332]|nr:putative succinyl-CoA ligase subunit alpha, mitochondrial [Cladorrhinum sp. PSN332]